MTLPNLPPELSALKRFSARVGADPLLVQGAGGNTSVKADGVLWIKASGTWLRNAETSDIMVPVALSPLLDALRRDLPEAERAQAFTIAEWSPAGLRPSIETTVHALMPQRVVVHVHCVETIAVAAHADAERRAGQRLRGLPWAFIPYCRPGLPLAHAIAARLKPDTAILVLGNHGLVAAADTVADAETLLGRASALLAQGVCPAPAPDTAALLRLAAGSDYRLPAEVAAHGAGADLASCRTAAGGSLYPDHVIFLGPGSVVARPGEDAAAAAARHAGGGRPAPVSILFPGKGIVMRRDASPGAEAMARCLADVCARIAPGAALRYLSEAENLALTDWDAEKYRQALDRQPQGAVQ